MEDALVNNTIGRLDEVLRRNQLSSPVQVVHTVQFVSSEEGHW